MTCRGLFTALDSLICLCVIFPLSVLHWRGTWQLQDVYFVPTNSLSSAWVSLFIGANVCLLELLLQPSLAALIAPRGPWVYVPVSRLHLYVHGWAVMCYWRGLWNLLDAYLSEDWAGALALYGVCQGVMLLTRTVRTAVGVPMALQLDVDPDLLEPDTVFKTPPAELLRFVADCCFSQFVIVSSNICVWRGIWLFCDAFIFPSDPECSALVSLAIGFSGVSGAFLLQWPTSRASALLDAHPRAKLAFEDVVFIALTWLNLLLWRGTRLLCGMYFLPDATVGGWVSHSVGTVGLMAVQAFNTVGLHGIVRDGSYAHGDGIYPTKYLRLLVPSSEKSAMECPLAAGSHVYTMEDLKPCDQTDKLLESEQESADDEASLVT